MHVFFKANFEMFEYRKIKGPVIREGRGDLQGITCIVFRQLEGDQLDIESQEWRLHKKEKVATNREGGD